MIVRLCNLFIIAFVLTGCSIPKYEWIHSHKEAHIWYQDKLVCEEKATQLAIELYPAVQNVSSVVVNTVVDGEQKQKVNQDYDTNEHKRVSYKNRLVQECLYGEGWEKVRIEEEKLD